MLERVQRIFRLLVSGGYMESGSNSNILFIYSDRVTLSDIPWGLTEIGREVQIYDKVITLQYYVEEQYLALRNFLQGHIFSMIITHNYSVMVSDICEEMHIKYVSWVFDSPLIDLYTSSYYNKYNYIFVFDKKQFERLSLREMPRLYHMPLAVNVNRVSALQISVEDENKYSCDISFVGSLYTENAFDTCADKIPFQIRERMLDFIKKRVLKWGKDQSIFELLNHQDVEQLTKIFHIGDWIDLHPGYYLEVQLLSRKIAEIERVCILNALALNHKVTLFTDDQTQMLENVKVCGRISYETEAPKVFYLSKINLNITLRSIETGVPQRILDIMGAGGFVLSNYQEELEELFIPGEEIVMFHDMSELIYMVNYYLNHEKERVRIAMNGYLKVKKHYTYEQRLQQILDIVEK